MALEQDLIPGVAGCHSATENPVALLERRRLIRLGRSVSALGLGGAGLNGISGQPITDVQAVETVHAALQAGIDFIDTSAGYGESERRIGLALRGVPRDLVFIASKTGTGDG